MAPAVGVFSHGPVGSQDDDFIPNKYPRWISVLYTTPPLGAALIKKIKKNCPKLKVEVGNL
jgi:hypothetical protein